MRRARPFSRRQLLTATISGAAAFAIAGRAQEKTWQAGAVRHLLPGVSHDRLLLKASFVRPLTARQRFEPERGRQPVCASIRPASSTRSTSQDSSPNTPITSFSTTQPADRSATRGRFRHFPVRKRRRNDSGSSYTPARAGILPPSIPIRTVRTGCLLQTGENSFSLGCHTNPMR